MVFSKPLFLSSLKLDIKKEDQKFHHANQCQITIFDETKLFLIFTKNAKKKQAVSQDVVFSFFLFLSDKNLLITLTNLHFNSLSDIMNHLGAKNNNQSTHKFWSLMSRLFSNNRQREIPFFCT